jgi:uncharacterized protein (DUF2126 family)
MKKGSDATEVKSSVEPWHVLFDRASFDRFIDSEIYRLQRNTCPVTPFLTVDNKIYPISVCCPRAL